MAEGMSTSKPRPPCWGLLKRRPCLVPTWRGWLALLAVGLGLLLFVGWRIHPFLAITDAVPGGALAIEGWAPDYALAEAVAEFKRYPYSKVFVTGGPLEQGAPLSEYKTYAELGAAILLRLGLDKNLVQAVPAARVQKDRTYASAVALRNWLRAHNAALTNLNIISVGAHGRRSRLLFEKAFGNGCRMGIISVEDQDYDPQHWWKSSPGVRTVGGEILAYGYARLLFRPPPEE